MTKRSDVMILCLNFVKIFVFATLFGLNMTLHHLLFLYDFHLFNLIRNTIALCFNHWKNKQLNPIIIMRSCSMLNRIVWMVYVYNMWCVCLCVCVYVCVSVCVHADNIGCVECGSSSGTIYLSCWDRVFQWHWNSLIILNQLPNKHQGSSCSSPQCWDYGHMCQAL